MNLITPRATYEASKLAARNDAARQLHCKQGFKQQGAVCKLIKDNKSPETNNPLQGKNPQQNTSEAQPQGKKNNRLRNIAIATSISVGGYLGLKKLNQNGDVSTVSSLLTVSPLLMNSDNIDAAINNSPFPDSIKQKASNLVGSTKLSLMKTILSGSGYKLESIDTDNNSFTYRDKKSGDIQTVGSAGSALLIFNTAPHDKKDPNNNIFKMGFQVNIGYDRNPVRSTEDSKALIRIANAAFKEHVRLLPDDCLVGCGVADDDGAGSKRATLYKRAGFAPIPNLEKGMDLYSVKVNGTLKKIKTDEDKQFVVDMASSNWKSPEKGKNNMSSIQSKNDSVRSVAYIAARTLARHDAKIMVRVPAKNGRKAYSYYREGKVATDEPEISFEQTRRPVVTTPSNATPVLTTPLNATATSVVEKVAEEDLYKLMNIRDLRKEVRARDISNYSYMTQDQLRAAIKLHDADPEYKENIRKSLQKEKDLATLKKVKSSDIGRAIGTVNPTLGRQYNLLAAISHKYKKNPTEALIYALPAILGVTKTAAFLLKQRRAVNVKESAGAAVNDADNYKKDINENVAPEGVNFYVGGYGRGSKDLYNRVANSPFASKEDADWIKNKSENIPINRVGEDQRTHNVSQDVFNNITTGYNMTMNSTFNRGKSKESVELAAQLYAHGTKYRTDKNGVKTLSAIQILAAEDGGIVARDALEILGQMPDGNKIAKRVKFVSLGTPYFGESKVDTPEVNLVGDGDPWGALPFNKGGQTQRTKDVSGASQHDYTASADVVGKVFKNMRASLSDRAPVDAESRRAYESSQAKAGNQQKAEANQQVADILQRAKERKKAEDESAFNKEVDAKLHEKANGNLSEFERLQRDVVAVREAQESVDKDRDKARKELRKQARAQKGVKK